MIVILSGICPTCGHRAEWVELTQPELAGCPRGHRWTRCPLCRCTIAVPPASPGDACADCVLGKE